MTFTWCFNANIESWIRTIIEICTISWSIVWTHLSIPSRSRVMISFAFWIGFCTSILHICRASINIVPIGCYFPPPTLTISFFTCIEIWLDWKKEVCIKTRKCYLIPVLLLYFFSKHLKNYNLLHLPSEQIFPSLQWSSLMHSRNDI